MALSETDVLTVRIAGLTVTLDLVGCDDPARARIFERYKNFLVPMQSAAPTIRIRVEQGPDYLPFPSSREWQIRTTSDKGHIEFESHFEKGWVDYSAGEGALVMRERGDPENFLRVLFAWLCLDQQGLLIHASGVISQGKGYVFMGASGSGKTTAARLSLHRTVLSDDMVIVKKEGERFYLYGVPFQGDFPEAQRTNASAELHRIFALAKDSDHFVSPLGVAEAVARLTACVPFVMSQPANAQKVIHICEELGKQVPIRELHFRPDARFWEVIDGRD